MLGEIRESIGVLCFYEIISFSLLRHFADCRVFSSLLDRISSILFLIYSFNTLLSYWLKTRGVSWFSIHTLLSLDINSEVSSSRVENSYTNSSYDCSSKSKAILHRVSGKRLLLFNYLKYPDSVFQVFVDGKSDSSSRCIYVSLLIWYK